MSCSTGIAQGRIRPHVSQTLPLAQTADAIRLLLERRSIGKVVVTRALARTVRRNRRGDDAAVRLLLAPATGRAYPAACTG